MNPWIIVAIAGLMETGWALGLKYSDGFTRLWPTVFTGVSLVVSMALLGIAVKTLPLGTAYAVWTGIGAAGTFLVGIAFFGDQLNFMRSLGVLLIIGGVITLKAAH